MTPAPISQQIAAVALSMPVMQTDLAPGTAVGEYVIECKLGEGGMGSVYGAVQPAIGKRVAVKVISAALSSNAEAVSRFMQEARAANHIGHGNILDVFSFGALPDGRSYFVMEWLNGEGLDERMKKGPIPFLDGCDILDQIADALTAAHEKGVTHRDLKPANVFLVATRSERPLVKLLDFGVAKLAGEGRVDRTRTGMMLGTPLYMSPEQARGRDVDSRSDIYALAAMAYEVLCGRLPFVADNSADLLIMHLDRQPPRPSEIWPEVPPEIDQLLPRMLAKEKSQRPTLGEFRELLWAFMGTASGQFTHITGSGLTPVPLRGRTPPTGMKTPVPLPVPQPRGATAQPRAAMPPPRPATPVPRRPGLPPRPTEKNPFATDSVPAVLEVVEVRSSGWTIALVAAVALLGIGGAAAWWINRSETPAQTASAEPSAPLPNPPSKSGVGGSRGEGKEVPATAPARGGAIVFRISTAARVEVDGKKVGNAVTELRVPFEQDGEHAIEISASGYRTYRATLEVNAGQTLELPVAMKSRRSRDKYEPPTPRIQ